MTWTSQQFVLAGQKKDTAFSSVFQSLILKNLFMMRFQATAYFYYDSISLITKSPSFGK